MQHRDQYLPDDGPCPLLRLLARFGMIASILAGAVISAAIAARKSARFPKEDSPNCRLGCVGRHDGKEARRKRGNATGRRRGDVSAQERRLARQSDYCQGHSPFHRQDGSASRRHVRQHATGVGARRVVHGESPWTRRNSRGRASAFLSAAVWLGCVVGASLMAGRAGYGQLSSPPGPRFRRRPARRVSRPPTRGRSRRTAVPVLRRVLRRAQFARRSGLISNCLHSPLSQRGPAMNVQGEPGDTGLSRYPPAEGERAFDRGPSMDVDQGRGDTGVSRYPPARGRAQRPARGTSTTRGRGAER